MLSSLDFAQTAIRTASTAKVASCRRHDRRQKSLVPRAAVTAKVETADGKSHGTSRQIVSAPARDAIFKTPRLAMRRSCQYVTSASDVTAVVESATPPASA